MKNPQAFPTHPDAPLSCDGMTLRDYFAARASEEDIRTHTYSEKKDQVIKNPIDGTSQIIFTNIIFTNTVCTREQAKYRYADAMLKAREA
jgi:hypothetical protein